jgi:hypothetical protein
VTVTKNEILASFNKPEDFLLALVSVSPSEEVRVRYVRRPFQREPDFGACSVNYNWGELWDRGDMIEPQRHEGHEGD